MSERRKAGAAHVTRLAPERFSAVAPLLTDLYESEQSHFTDHPQLSRDLLARQAARPISPSFSGENLIFGAWDSRRLVGFCWCVLFDPGNGLEGEIAELYVAPGWRAKGLGAQLVARAVALFAERRVTFASVWTRSDNPAATAAYRRAGFVETSQLVMTWYPPGDG